MADSIDRVFVHALSTVKRIPRTGATRPPPAERLRLYGLYKQAMEGDVEGVMERPRAPTSPGKCAELEELHKEREKWDAWYGQRGVGKTQAKRLYIEKLIATMKTHAHGTQDARELVAELEFVWDQIKDNSNSSGNTSPSASLPFQQGDGGVNTVNKHLGSAPLAMLKPISEDDEAEQYTDLELDPDQHTKQERKIRRWRRAVENALIKMTAEVAALREQIATGRAYQTRGDQSAWNWLGWFLWTATKHITTDCLALILLLICLRRRKDRRVEDAVRSILNVGREYARRLLPAG